MIVRSLSVFRRGVSSLIAVGVFATFGSSSASDLVPVYNKSGKLQQVNRRHHQAPPKVVGHADPYCCPPAASPDDARPQTPSPDSQPPSSERPQAPSDLADLGPEQFAGLGSTSMSVPDSSVSSAQAAAPYMMGDLFTVGTGMMVIPVLTGPGTPFTENVNPTLPPISPTPMPVDPALPAGFPNAEPIRFVSSDNSPAFPPRLFTSTNPSITDNANFVNGQHDIPIGVEPGFTQDSQAYLNAQHPSGSVLPTGQTASGGGTAQFIQGQAVFDPEQSLPIPPGGRDILNTDLFNLTTNYLYTPNVYFSPQQPTVIIVPNPGNSGAAVLGINKIAENTSPLPRDRIFFNYSLFEGTPLGPSGVTVNRFVPGFEKTFFDNSASVEMRFPFAATVNPDLVFTTSGITSANGAVFGNMSVVFKALVSRTDSFAMSAGLQIVVPTAPGLNVSLPDGRRIVEIPNQAVHAMPFIGAIYTPNAQFFAQGFVQADIDVNGNPVLLNPDLQGLSQVGRLHGVNLLFVDLNAGYWLRRGRRGALTGFAPTIELHYNQSTEATPYLQSNGFMIGSNLGQVSNQSATIGCYLEYEDNTTLALGYTAPIGNGFDQGFSGELRAFVTRRFGATSRAARVAL